MKKAELYGIYEVKNYKWPENFFETVDEAIEDFTKDVPKKFKADIAVQIKTNNSVNFIIKSLSDLEKEYNDQVDEIVNLKDEINYHDDHLSNNSSNIVLDIWDLNEFKNLSEKLYAHFRSNNSDEELYQFAHKLFFKLSKDL